MGHPSTRVPSTMPEPLAYLNGTLLPLSAAAVPVHDAGFVLGATVTEQLRTFGGRLFRLEAHLDRLDQSLAIVGIQPELSRQQFVAAAERLVEHNHALLDPADDLGLSIFVTPGPYATLAPDSHEGPLVCLHTYPLPFRLWHQKYDRGEALATPEVRQMSPRVLPRALKCRSRMHYFLADRQARQIDPAARALLLDADDYVTEATTASMVLYRADTGMVTPPRERILPGISMATIDELASQFGVAVSERDLRVEDVLAADEVLLASTSSCALPAVRLNGQPIGNATPGPFYRRLLAAWSDFVGLDIIAQAHRFANRG